MKKVLALLLTLCVVAGIVACSAPAAPAPAEAPAAEVAQAPEEPAAEQEAAAEPAVEPMTLKLGTTGPAPSDDVYIASTYFADAVQEVSNGAMTIEVIANGALGNTAQHYAQLREGSLDIFTTALDTGTTMIGGEDFAVAVVPYLFKDRDHYAKFLESDVLDEMMSSVSEANNVHYLGPIGFRFPRGLSCTFPVTSVEDIKNLKIRVPDTASMMKIWEAWGANPQVISASELYTALQGGMVDAQDNDLQTSFNNGWLEVTKNYMEIEYIQQSCILYVSGSTWEKLTDEQKSWLEEGEKLGHERYNTDHANAYAEMKEKAIAEGVEFPEVDVESFRTAANEAAKALDGELWTAGLYDKIAALAD